MPSETHKSLPLGELFRSKGQKNRSSPNTSMHIQLTTHIHTHTHSSAHLGTSACCCSNPLMLISSCFYFFHTPHKPFLHIAQSSHGKWCRIFFSNSDHLPSFLPYKIHTHSTIATARDDPAELKEQSRAVWKGFELIKLSNQHYFAD